MTNVNGKSDIIPTESENTRTVGNFSHGSRETPATSSSPMELDRRTSDGKPFIPRSRGLLGIREAAQKDKKLKFTSRFHHITPELLRSSFFDLKKQAAPGVDGQTWNDYAVDLEQRINDLHGRMHREAHRAKPSKWTYIFKLDSRNRPLGIAALEDKIVQQATRVILECMYEEDFKGFSYCFRPQLFRKRHDDLAEVDAWLQSVFRGWCQYYAVPGNYDRLRQFREAIQATWLKGLR